MMGFKEIGTIIRFQWMYQYNISREQSRNIYALIILYTFDPVIPLPGVYPKGIINDTYKYLSSRMSNPIFFIIEKQQS